MADRAGPLLVWLLLGGGAIAEGVWNLVEVYRDWRAVRPLGDAARNELAAANLIIQSSRVGAKVITVAGGLVEFGHGGRDAAWWRKRRRVGLYLLLGLMFVNGAVALRARRRIYALMDRTRREKP